MRVAAYIRVSSQEQTEGYSLAAQERAITQYATSHDWEIVRWYRDEGLSARVDDIAKRPGFKSMLEDAREGRFDSILVHKLDRFARNRQVAFNTFAELTKMRVGFASIAENMDYSTPAGQLMLTMLVGMSQFYSDNLSFETKKGKAERKRQGIYNGLLPFGVTLDVHGVPVADTGPWACNLTTRAELIPYQGLELAFQLAAQGKSDRQVAMALNERGFRTSGNRGQNPFTKDSVRVILRNRFYLGELPDGKGWVPGRHRAIIDPELFQAVQKARQRNRTRLFAGSTTRQPWALSGMAICGMCGSTIRRNGAYLGRQYLACSGRVQGARCRLPGIAVQDVIAGIAAWLQTANISSETSERAWDIVQRTRSSMANHQSQRLTIERKLARLRDLYLEGDLGKDEYHRRRDALTEERDSLPAAATNSATDHGADWNNSETLADRFKSASAEVQQQICRALLSTVVLQADRTIDVVPHPEISAFFSLSAP